MDLIDREQAINALDELCERVCQYSKEQRAIMCGACPLGDAFDVIDNMPSAEKTGRLAWPSAGKIGRWLESRESRFRPFMCSNCGCIYDVDTSMGKPIWNYCPNCGAKMEG